MNMIEAYIKELFQNSSPEKPLWNQEMILQGKKPHWNYIDGCMMTAALMLYENTENPKYLEFTDNFLDYFVNEDGNIRTFHEEEYNLDNINEGKALFKLYDYTGRGKYRKALDTIYKQIKNQPRTKDGNFWHKKIYPNQVWLDGLYMALPFYMEYEKRFNKKKNYPDIMNQIRNVVLRMKDKDTGLYFHAYDSTRQMFWCNPETGLSNHFWLRSIGWFVMALVDILEILEPSDVEITTEISTLFKDLIKALIFYQDSSGMWYQIIDRGQKEGNYLETSGTAIISYAILKAVHLEILPESYRKFGLYAFDGICRKYLYEKSGKMNLGGICLVAGLGGKDKRDGSFEYYISEPVVKNEAKGIAPFLLAYIYKKGKNNY